MGARLSGAAVVPREVARRLRPGARLSAGAGGGRVPGGDAGAASPRRQPPFSWMARRWFQAPVNDLYCGLRGFSKVHYERLEQTCRGMEFAVEMIVESSVASPDRRGSDHPAPRRAYAPQQPSADGTRRMADVAIPPLGAALARVGVGMHRGVTTDTDTDGFDAYAARYEHALNAGLRYSGEGPTTSSTAACWLSPSGCAAWRTAAVVLDFGCGVGRQHGAPERLARRATERSASMSRWVPWRSRGRRVQVRTSSSCRGGPPRAHSRLRLLQRRASSHRAADRDGAVEYVFTSLRPGGLFAMCENNPWNPGTRLVMRAIPFDRDAVPLSDRAARLLLRAAGFEVLGTVFLFVFPRVARGLRPFERRLRALPLGCQYMILARRPADGDDPTTTSRIRPVARSIAEPGAAVASQQTDGSHRWARGTEPAAPVGRDRTRRLGACRADRRRHRHPRHRVPRALAGCDNPVGLRRLCDPRRGESADRPAAPGRLLSSAGAAR